MSPSVLRVLFESASATELFSTLPTELTTPVNVSKWDIQKTQRGSAADDYRQFEIDSSRCVMNDAFTTEEVQGVRIVNKQRKKLVSSISWNLDGIDFSYFELLL